MMGNKMTSAIIKGMLMGAVIGGGAAYISGMDLTCKCRNMRKKAGRAYRCMCKSFNNVMDMMR